MSKASLQIFAALKTMFVELDAKMLKDQKAWAKGRVAAIAEFKNSPEVATRRAVRGVAFHSFSHWYYTNLFNIAGGKTWYNVFNGRNEAMVNEFVEKNCKAIAEKRNATIARKLDEAGIIKVVSSEVAYSNNGFDGTFVVNTDKGQRRVTINTIYAGGYNIQCFHQRTLVKVR